jgi:HPt (histidine-containing phosphotransfer) domain-containing protein
MVNNYNKTAKVCNLDYLNDLAKGNPEFVKEMIDIFIEDNCEELQSLEKNIQQKNYPLIKEVAHKMRSTIAFVGLDRIIENNLSEIEELALTGSGVQKIEISFLKVKEICQKAAEELKLEFTIST